MSLQITSRLLKQLEEDHAKEMFLVLQGSGTYLWQFLGAPDRPILRNTFLDMIDDALATRCAEAESAVSNTRLALLAALTHIGSCDRHRD